MSKRKQKRFMKLYEPVHERFERFCKARTYAFSDHRDLMNESLLIAYNKMDSLQNQDALLSFLIGIAIRLVGNKLQKKKEDVVQDFQMNLSKVEARCQDADVHFLYLAIDQLPIDQKEAVLMKEISGMKMKEIAEVQQVSEDAVKQRVKRGRDKLTEILSREMSYEIRNEQL